MRALRWIQNSASGFGLYTHVDLTVVEGIWAEDLQNGPGVERWADGSRYCGCA